MKSKFLKVILIILLCIFCTILVFANFTFFSYTGNINTKNVLAQEGYNDIYYMDVLNYNGVTIDKIHFNNDNSVYGWCIDKGANLYGGQGRISKTNNGFENNNAREGCSGSIQWLLDNMYRVGDSVSQDEKTYFKNHLASILNIDMSSYSDDDIFAYEQFALWHFTDNVTKDPEIAYPTSNELYSKLYKAAQDHSNYTHKETFVSVDKSAVVVADNGAVGPFKVVIDGPAKLTSNLGSLYKSADLNESNILADGEIYNGDIYLKATDKSNVNASIEWDFYVTKAYKYDTTGNPGEYGDQSFMMITREKKSDIVEFEKETSGSFNINLIKYKKGTTTPLPGATFDIVVKDGNEQIYTGTKTTSVNEADLGKAVFSNIPIKEEGKKYNVIVTETISPEGYIGIDGPIEFEVTTQKVGDEYKLVAAGNITSKVKNAKKVEVKEGEILIEAENRTTSVDIHKGVKSVENQDSGYFHMGITEVELKDLYHEWVVETTIPEGVDKYKKYLITDPVDLSKLEFSGIDRVKVERIDKDGKVLETLTKDKDYQVEYNEDEEKQKGNLVVTYINKKEGKNFHGEFLTEAGVKERAGIEGTKIRVTFNTTFKVNENGKLAVLDGAVTNAENKSTLTYDNGSGKEEEKDSEQPEVHTGAVSIFKYEDTNGNGVHDEGEKALVGAEFKIALTEEDAKAGKFIKINGKELIAVTNEHGIATFVGLSFGGDAKDDEKNLKDGLYKYDWETASREYYIVETKTPAGYEKLEDAVKVVVSKNSSEIIDMTDKINEMESVGNRPLVFDLALRKWVTQAIVTENGKTIVYETGHKAEDNPEEVVKVDLKKSKLKDVEVKFRYSIRVTNEGEVAGEAEEITDYIPEGLKFVKEDNPEWEITENERVVKTGKLKGVTLEPEESAEVEIVLTWINSETTMGVMINTAEISKDHNEYGIHDIDSTPNNKKKGEDDIDDAPVMLTIKTGSEIIAYIGIGLGFIMIVACGVIMIKRSFFDIM